MIVVDIETSGGFAPDKIGIWQIGAIELENPKNMFLEESRIDDSDIVMEEALKVIGKTEEYLRDKKKQSQKELLEKFFRWAEKIKNKDMLCHNPQFDYSFLKIRADKYNLKFPFHYKCFDLHTIAAIKYLEVNKKFLIEDGKSGMNSSFIFEFCGLKDERVRVKDGKIAKEGKPHNGLEDAKLEAECFFRIVYGMSLLDEFLKFPVPPYLQRTT